MEIRGAPLGAPLSLHPRVEDDGGEIFGYLIGTRNHAENGKAPAGKCERECSTDYYADAAQKTGEEEFAPGSFGIALDGFQRFLDVLQSGIQISVHFPIQAQLDEGEIK
jgi:hypothetical protein